MSDIRMKYTKFDSNEINNVSSVYLNDYPIVYILYNNKKKRPLAYIGQTVHLKRRMADHIKNVKRKNLEDVLFISHSKFNQSATYNIETNLINYFIADNKYKLQNKSQTADNRMHNYFQKEFYNNQVFREIWSELQNRKIVRDDIETLENKDIFKLSPYKELSEKQLDVKLNILDYCKRNIGDDTHSVFFVEGEAGTGKSVVLSSTFNTLQDYASEKNSPLYGTNNYLLVNHSEMIKTYKDIADSLPNLKKKNFLKPTTFINQQDKLENSLADVVFVDEAHLLLSKKDSYNNFNFENQLEEIIKRSKITIVVYDSKQVLKLKSYWDESKLDRIRENYPVETYKLTDQFRIDASQDIVNWIDHFVNKNVLPLPPENTGNENSNFELKIFEDSIQMHENIKARNKEAGLSRVVSTFDYIHKKDGVKYYVEEESLNLPWNETGYKKTWAEEPFTINEVGSIYTVQGFDLNYVGVVLGPSVSYDPDTDSLVIKTDNYKDTEAYRKREDLSESETQKAKEKIVLNSINVLMKRGIHGLYIYAHNKKLRKRLLELQRKRNEKE